MQRNLIKRSLSIVVILGINFMWMTATAQRAVETNAPQTLPFSQNWSNTGLITAADDWSGVPGIQAFQGNDITTATGVDPRTLMVDGSATVLDVIPNVANCDTNTSGGIAECEGTLGGAAGNPTIALQGSGTADAAHLVIYLNTTGQSNIRVQYTARDIDGSADNSIQQIATQYRVGNVGNFINVPGGYIADATTGPSLATLVTPVDVTLPAAANNQPLVEVRIMTTNAVSNDEWVGIDDITISNTGTARVSPAVLDFDGDTRTDYVVARDSNGVFTPGGFIQWFVSLNGTAAFFQQEWGLIENDDFAFGDYDGDGKADFGVWRKVPTNFEGAVQATFYYVHSSNGTIHTDPLGLDTDEVVIGDYNGDGRSDTAVMRHNGNGTTSWFYRPSPVLDFVEIVHGGEGSSAVGDYDGDGKNDPATFNAGAGGAGVFTITYSSGGTSATPFGLATDFVVPGDYDGDKKTDLAVARFDGDLIRWNFEPSGTGGITEVSDTWGLGATDYLTPGDYTGDGKADYAVWRDAALGEFYVMTPLTRFIYQRQWGLAGDLPVGSVQVSNDSFKQNFK